MIIVKPSAELISHTPNPEQLIELSGRTCYKSEDKITEDSAADFVERILKKRGHASIGEHASATFRLVTNRYTTHQLVRHRIAAYSQESQRYCNYSKKKFDEQVAFVCPIELADNEDATLMWAQSCEEAEKNYFDMIKFGIKPEIARSVLPSSCKTEIVVTMNFRTWLHFITLRTSPHAQADIRFLANDIQRQLLEIAPNVFKP